VLRSTTVTRLTPCFLPRSKAAVTTISHNFFEEDLDASDRQPVTTISNNFLEEDVDAGDTMVGSQ
jgi:hypothetical protein